MNAVLPVHRVFDIEHAGNCESLGTIGGGCEPVVGSAVDESGQKPLFSR